MKGEKAEQHLILIMSDEINSENSIDSGIEAKIFMGFQSDKVAINFENHVKICPILF